MSEKTLTDAALEAAAELRAIASRRSILDAQQAQERAELDKRETAARVVLLSTLAAGDVGLGPDGTPLVAVKVTRRFNAARAAEVLPRVLEPEGFAAICTPVVDSRKAKDVLAPSLYALAQTESAPSVVLA